MFAVKDVAYHLRIELEKQTRGQVFGDRALEQSALNDLRNGLKDGLLFNCIDDRLESSSKLADPDMQGARSLIQRIVNSMTNGDSSLSREALEAIGNFLSEYKDIYSSDKLLSRNNVANILGCDPSSDFLSNIWCSLRKIMSSGCDYSQFIKSLTNIINFALDADIDKSNLIKLVDKIQISSCHPFPSCILDSFLAEKQLIDFRDDALSNDIWKGAIISSDSYPDSGKEDLRKMSILLKKSSGCGPYLTSEYENKESLNEEENDFGHILNFLYKSIDVFLKNQKQKDLSEDKNKYLMDKVLDLGPDDIMSSNIELEHGSNNSINKHGRS